jgi:hypothetical protein
MLTDSSSSSPSCSEEEAEKFHDSEGLGSGPSVLTVRKHMSECSSQGTQCFQALPKNLPSCGGEEEAVGIK